MNHFKGKQFQQDVIIVAVGYYLRYNLSYREVQIVALTFLIRRFIVGCKNMANYFIKFGKRKIKNSFIHGKWMKRTSKLKENGIICIEPSMQMV
ncbi:Integrase core domain protein [Enterococcus faecium]|nr:transposase for insertion sequence-like element IS431mec [Enterococcus faecium]STD66495.1 Integrase core domain protein [Enterococcus faecium]VFA47070.1 transposase [Enterococcus faecium]